MTGVQTCALPICLRHDAYQDIQHIRRRKPGTVHGKKLPADPHLGGHPRGQMHIAGPRLPGAAYDFFYRRHRRPTSPFETAPAAKRRCGAISIIIYNSPAKDNCFIYAFTPGAPSWRSRTNCPSYRLRVSGPRWWVTAIVRQSVRPASSSSISSAVPLSRLAVNSSSSRILLPRRRALARLSRCLSPPERFFPFSVMTVASRDHRGHRVHEVGR